MMANLNPFKMSVSPLSSETQNCPEKLQECFKSLAEAAGRVALQCQSEDNLETAWKADGTPVTAADIEADRIIRQGLEAAFPNIPVVSEETFMETIVSRSGKGPDCFFIVDPIDGTSGYRRGKDEYTVNIALVENGLPSAGVVFAPAFGRMFLTTRDGELIEFRDNRARIHEKISALAGLPRAIASRSRRSQSLIRDYLLRMNIDNHQTMSSSLKFCLLAVGEFDLYPRFGRTMEWDTAAGHAVLQSVGGNVVEMTTTQPLTYGKAGYENPNFVAMVPGIKLLGRA